MSKHIQFSDVLREAMTKAGITQREFAKKCRFSQGLPPLMLAGKRTPPVEKLDEMASALNLSGKAKDEFELHVYLAHCPEPIRKRLLDNEARLEKLEADYALLLRALKAKRQPI